METHITLKGDEHIQTFGGEAYIDEIIIDDYGINFGELHIHEIKPCQMISLACNIANHLIVNGHRFKLENTNEQDMPVRLSYIEEDKKPCSESDKIFHILGLPPGDYEALEKYAIRKEELENTLNNKV